MLKTCKNMRYWTHLYFYDYIPVQKIQEKIFEEKRKKSKLNFSSSFSIIFPDFLRFFKGLSEVFPKTFSWLYQDLLRTFRTCSICIMQCTVPAQCSVQFLHNAMKSKCTMQCTVWSIAKVFCTWTCTFRHWGPAGSTVPITYRCSTSTLADPLMWRTCGSFFPYWWAGVEGGPAAPYTGPSGGRGSIHRSWEIK